MVILIIGFQTKAFLCGIWNLYREKLYPSGSSDVVLHSSINRCVVNGKNAMERFHEIFICLFIYVISVWHPGVFSAWMACVLRRVYI